MRIAQVAPLYETVPPRRYGGTERVVAWLVDGLVARGHEVTLYGAEGSTTSAQHRVIGGPRLGLDVPPLEALARHLTMLEAVADASSGFDVVHFHLEVAYLPVARRLASPSVATLHNRVDSPGLPELYAAFADVPLVSISDAQRAPLEPRRWAGTVHHGLPADRYRRGEGRGGYLAFLGRMAEEKGPHTAIEIARAVGIPLRMAAKIDAKERPFHDAVIAPRLGPGVDYVGEVDEAGKQAFLGDALALLFPIRWPEPFGLVMIEALACGTPVIAFRAGSVPEVIEEGVGGRVVDDVAGAVEAIRGIDRLDRAAVRASFERRFTVDRMVERHERVYGGLIAAGDPLRRLDAGRPRPR